jgi:Na+-translocating ferredoxin:NAD+ oxidoreductase RnfD subunit
MELTPVGCGLAVFTLIAGLVIGGLGAFILAPSMLNLDVTRTALAVDAQNLRRTADALAGGAQAQEANATQQAIYAEGTRVQLGATATSAAMNIANTMTVDAAISTQQVQNFFIFATATQDAMNYIATLNQQYYEATLAAFTTPTP